MHSLTCEAIGNRGHKLLRDGIAGELSLVTRDESGILKLVGAGAEQAMAVNVRRQDETLGFASLRNEHSEAPLHLEIHLLQLPLQNPKKGVFRTDHRRLPNQLLKNLQKVREVGIDRRIHWPKSSRMNAIRKPLIGPRHSLIVVSSKKSRRVSHSQN